MEFNDRRGPRPAAKALARVQGQGTRKDGMRTRESAARMQNTHNDIQAGRAVLTNPAPQRSSGRGMSAAQTILPGVRFSAPGERTVAPLPMMHADQTRSSLQMAADRLTSRPQSGPESPLLGMASTAHDIHRGQATMVRPAPSFQQAPLQHQPVQQRTSPWSEFQPTAQAARTILPAGRRGFAGMMR